MTKYIVVLDDNYGAQHHVGSFDTDEQDRAFEYQTWCEQNLENVVGWYYDLNTIHPYHLKYIGKRFDFRVEVL